MPVPALTMVTAAFGIMMSFTSPSGRSSTRGVTGKLLTRRETRLRLGGGSGLGAAICSVLAEAGLLTTEAIEAIDREAKAEVDRAAEKAQTFPEPSPDNLEDEVYAP